MKFSSLLAIVGLTLISVLSLPSQTVRVIFSSGEASLQRPDEPALRPIVKGETVIIGTRIVTGADGRVVLTPMPGVKSIIAPNSILLLESSTETRTSPTEVTHKAVLDLKEGAIVSDLQKPEGVAYDYSIRTARGLAGARGTTFTVGIDRAGVQSVVVTHGVITIAFDDGRTATLSLGQISVTTASGETKNVAKISDLSPADQAAAQEIAEATLTELSKAIESGLEVSPGALSDALSVAESLGVTVSPELKAQIERILAVSTTTNTSREDTNTQTVKEVVTRDALPAGVDLEAFRATLNETQLTSFNEIISLGFDGNANSPTLAAKFTSPAFVASFVELLDLYSVFREDEGFDPGILVTLGILGGDNTAAVGADPVGLTNLVDAYQYILGFYSEGSGMAGTEGEGGEFSAMFEGSFLEKLLETDFAKTRANKDPLYGANFFFPGNGTNNGPTIHDVSFDSNGDYRLTVGATRELKINNTGFAGVAFNAGYSEGESGYGEVFLLASNLVDLNNTKFGANVSYILIEAATINLANIQFPEGSYVALGSKLGSANFGSSVFGKVNFITNVKYGETVLNAGNFGDDIRGTQNDVTGGNVQIHQIGSSLD